MMRWIAILGVPSAVVVGLVELLNRLEAGPGIAMVALGLTAVVGGAMLGYFADRLPELSGKRRRDRLTARHLDH
jgi:hypothetical protein